MRRTGFKRRNKYQAIKTTIDGVTFDSKLEAHWYSVLKTLQNAGTISELELQHEFTITVADKQVCTYIADFFYWDKDLKDYVVADAKGLETPVFRLKWKLMQALYPGYQYRILRSDKLRFGKIRLSGG